MLSDPSRAAPQGLGQLQSLTAGQSVLQQSSHGLVSCALSIPWLPAPHPGCSHPSPALPVAPPLSFPLLQLGWGTAWGSCSPEKGDSSSPDSSSHCATRFHYTWEISILDQSTPLPKLDTSAMQSQACSTISGHPPCPTKHGRKKEGAGGNPQNQSEDYKP